MKKGSFFAIIIFMILFCGCSNILKNNTVKVGQVDEDSSKIESFNDDDSKVEEDVSNEDESKDENAIESKIDKKESEDTTENEKKDSGLTNKPLNGKVIVIDPGHSSKSNLEKEKESPNSEKLKIKDGGGATGVSTNIPEYKTCMSIGLKLKDILEESGFKVIMTKTDNDVSLGNIERAKVGNDNNADLVIRIHADSADAQSAQGASMLIPSKNNLNTKQFFDFSKQYGQVIIDKYCSSLNLNNRGIVYRDDMTGFNWSKVPVVLLEMGFLSNSGEDKFLSDTKNHKKIANAIGDGIKLAFNN